jgi:hypothetical protein
VGGDITSARQITLIAAWPNTNKGATSGTVLDLSAKTRKMQICYSNHMVLASLAYSL